MLWVTRGCKVIYLGRHDELASCLKCCLFFVPFPDHLSCLYYTGLFLTIFPVYITLVFSWPSFLSILHWSFPDHLSCLYHTGLFLTIFPVYITLVHCLEKKNVVEKGNKSCSQSTLTFTGKYLRGCQYHLSRDMTKPTKWVWPSEDSDQPRHPPSLIRVFACAQWVAKGPMFLHADSEGSDQTGQMPKLIWVFAGRTLILLVLLCRLVLRSHRHGVSNYSPLIKYLAYLNFKSHS